MPLGFETALSALNAARTAIGVIGHNLANSATKGYSRQRVILGAETPDRVGPRITIGRGVQILGVDRIADEFLAGRLRDQQGELGRAERSRDLYSALESAYGEPSSTGVNGALGAFFDELRGFAFQPGDASAQSGVLQKAGDLAQAFRTVRSGLLNVRRDAADGVGYETSEVNRLLGQVATLNASVAASSGAAGLAPDLQDRVDQLLSELSSHIDVRVDRSTTGRLLVTSNGVALVDSQGAHALVVKVATSPNEKTEVRVQGSGVAFVPRSGALRGALDLDAELVGDRLKTLDAVAASIIRRVNHAHATGVPASGGYALLTAERSFRDRDGNGVLGDEPLKNQDLPFAIGNGVLTVNMTADADGSTRQTRIPVDGDSMTVGEVVAALDAVPGLNAIVDGAGRLRLRADPGYRFDFSNRVNNRPDVAGTFGVEVTAGGRYTGTLDSAFVLRPLTTGEIGVTAGLQIQVERRDGSVIGVLDVGAGYAPGESLDLADGLTVSFGAGTVDPATSGTPVVEGIADGDTSGILEALGVNGLYLGADSGTIDVSGVLKSDPSGLAAGLGGGAADNGNLSRLLAAETASDDALDGYDAPKRYAELVADSGFQARRTSDAADVQSALVEALNTRRAQVSGVNVDEELVRLEESQQAYQVAARFTKTLSEVSDVLVHLAE